MNEEKNNEALSLFLLNSELYPESQNVWDSLAEIYWRLENINKAKELYKKSIKMNPSSSTGENSKNMLNQIETSNN